MIPLIFKILMRVIKDKGYDVKYISRSKIVIGYYGSDSLKDFEENYKEFVWIQICSIAGYSKKLEVHKRKHKTASPDAAK